MNAIQVFGRAAAQWQVSRSPALGGGTRYIFTSPGWRLAVGAASPQTVASYMPTPPPLDSIIAKLWAQGITLPPGPVHADGYGDSAELSRALLALIRSGRKRAGTGLLWSYEHDGEHIARTGDIEIVLDHRLEPAMVTRIVSSEIVAFEDVTAEYAAIEGEGDGSLDYWRRSHWSFFTRECRRIGREPGACMPVICSVFEVLSVVPLQSGARPGA